MCCTNTRRHAVEGRLDLGVTEHLNERKNACSQKRRDKGKGLRVSKVGNCEVRIRGTGGRLSADE